MILRVLEARRFEKSNKKYCFNHMFPCVTSSSMTLLPTTIAEGTAKATQRHDTLHIVRGSQGSKIWKIVEKSMLFINLKGSRGSEMWKIAENSICFNHLKGSRSSKFWKSLKIRNVLIIWRVLEARNFEKSLKNISKYMLKSF